MAISPSSTASTPTENYPELLSLAVHELRTPCSVVAGYLRLLQRDGADPITDQQRKMISEAEKSCARFIALIGELSDISKLDSGAIGLVSQPFDVFSLVAEVAEHVHEASDREVRLTPTGEPAGAPATGDPVRLRAAFQAIFRAIMREKIGPATVVAERRRDARDGRPSAIIVVADASDVQAVYDSSPVAFEEKRGGLGLALPLARRVIEGHGGRIWSPAPAVGDDRARGSAVIMLPLAESKL
jgi:two-component system capsular synthesis sensor histidine kinase RcsC